MALFMITEEKPYLWFPVKKGNPLKLVTVFSEKEKEKKLLELQIPWPLPEEEPDFWNGFSMKKWAGQKLVLCGDFPEERLSRIRQEASRPAAQPQRPFLHLAPESGWMNDPNGLIYDNGWYHCYYQYHPFGTEWGPMYWGHAKSRDLLHWEDRDIALTPDETGTMFSGCAFRDAENRSGYGKDALLFYYTAAGGNNPWSLEEPFTQRLAVSLDKGETLKKKGCVLGHIAGENRDPMVFWHEPSKAYCMALYLEENTFALFRSSDLIHFEETQCLELPGAWECPALFPLPVEKEDGTVGVGEKWVFWSADGYYFVGSFDGYSFLPESPRREAYLNKIPYAAQLFAGLPEPYRAIQMTWLRLKNRGENRTGMMALPAKLSLARRGNDCGRSHDHDYDYFLRTEPAVPLDAPELQRLGFSSLQTGGNNGNGLKDLKALKASEKRETSFSFSLEDRPVLLEGFFENAFKEAFGEIPEKGISSLVIELEKDGRSLLKLSQEELAAGRLLLGGEELTVPKELRKEAEDGKFQLLADRGVLELRLGNGLCWAAVSGPADLKGIWNLSVSAVF